MKKTLILLMLCYSFSFSVVFDTFNEANDYAKSHGWINSGVKTSST